jgi:protein-S-isoprenylcysteine O-methyltransferase Ste14
MAASRSPNRSRRALLAATRVWLPVGIAVGGVVAIVIGHGRTSSPWAGAGVGLIIVALIVWMLNWLFRLGVESNRERDREEEAREYFDRHGHWPEENGETR